MIFVVALAVFAILMFSGGLRAWLMIRRNRAQAIVQTLALITGRNAPLASSLRAAARQDRGKLARIFTRLAHRLEVGDSLSVALRTAYPTCSGDVIGVVRAGEESGTLPSALHSLAATTATADESSSRAAPALMYFVAMSMILPPIFGAFIIFLVPKFRDIFIDFGVYSIPFLDRVVAVADTLVDAGPLLALLAAIATILLAQIMISRFFCPRIPDRFQLAAVLFDTLTWYTPVLRRVVESRAWARQLPILQAAVHVGHDIPAAARQAAHVDANYHARRRLRRWADQVESGVQPAAAARRLRFPTAITAALSTSRGQSDLAASLDYLCSYYRGLLVHWEQLLASLAIPCVVLFWGAVALIFVLSVILPMQYLLNGLMANVD